MSIIRTDSLQCEQLAPFINMNENQLKHLNEPQEGVFVAESPVVIERAYDGGYIPRVLLTDERHLKDVEYIAEGGAEIYVVPNEILEGIQGFEMTRGALCLFGRKKLPGLREVCGEHGRIAVLEDVQNPTNVGAIFRSAAAMGVGAVILTGKCADPLYRRAIRVSMGNVFLIPWTIWDEDTTDLLDILKTNGYNLSAMALADRSISIEDDRLKKSEKMAIVLGTESNGLRPDTMKACDYIVKIPMKEGVDSLNVAAAAAVAFWELRQR